MSRLTPLAFEQMTDEQQRVFQVISSSRKTGLGGPFSVWVRTPALAEPANLLHNAFRLHGALNRRLFEMLILMVAHSFQSKYVWTFHVGQARKAGLEDDAIVAIEQGIRPDLNATDENALYDVVKELLSTKTLRTESYNAAIDLFEETLLIEIISAVGFYSNICLLVNVFDVPAAAPTLG